VSLESLARAARRATNVPSERAPAPRPPEVAAFVSPATEPSPPPDFGAPSSLPAALSTLPPPVQLPSEPPRIHVQRPGNAALRALGVPVVRPTVGALVPSARGGVKRGLDAHGGGRVAAVRAVFAPPAPSGEPASPVRAPVPAAAATTTAVLAAAATPATSD